MKAQLNLLWIVSLTLFSLSQMSCDKPGKELFPPSALFSIANQTVQVKETVQFTNASTLAESYEWNFGDGTTSTLANPTHAYSSTGIYNVTLIATNMDGQDTFSLTVTVTANIFPGESVDNISVGATYSSIKNELGTPSLTVRLILPSYTIYIVYFDQSGLAFGFVNQSITLKDTDTAITIFVYNPFEGTTEEGLALESLQTEVEAVYGAGEPGSGDWYKYKSKGIDFHYKNSQVDKIMLYEVDGFNGDIDANGFYQAFLQNE